MNLLAYDRTIRERASAICEEIFGFGLEVENIPDRRLQLLAVDAQRRTTNAINLGTGFIQLLWLATSLDLAMTDDAGAAIPVVGIEEPELHLHPGKQPEVAGMLANFVRQGIRIICTTQSEHFLTSVLQLVLEGTLLPSDLSVYYLTNGSAEPLVVDERGRLSGGLRGFFEANEEQLRRQIDLLTKSV